MARRRESSVHRALVDKDLLGCVVSYVGGETGRQSVEALGKVPLVCRTWREVATCDGLWKGIEEEVMVPALSEEEGKGSRAVGRDRLVQYGRMLVQERRVWSEVNWAFSLDLHVEILDRWDGVQMLSARGPLVARPRGGLTVCFPRWMSAMRLATFSAARLNPSGSLDNIWEYFGYSGTLCVRVTVRDRRTGKEGLLWEEGFGTVRQCAALTPYWEARLPEGTRSVISGARSMVGGAGDGLQCYTKFFVCPEPDQAGVAERDRLYRVATDDDELYVIDDDDDNDEDEHTFYPFSLKIVGTDIARVRTAIRALC
jgi:hypothetical protein